MGENGEKKTPIEKKGFLLISTQAQVKMTRVQRSTNPGLKNTQVMYRDKKLWMYF